MKNKIIILCLPIILLIGCAVKEVTLNENINIDHCKEITIELANQIAENISITMTDSQKDIYKINNFSFTFSDEKQDEDTVTINIKAESDWTLIRDPKQSPVIRGMFSAKEQLQSQREKELAQNVIDGFLAEMMPEYEQTQHMETLLVVKFAINNKSEYNLLYNANFDGEDHWYDYSEYCTEFLKEDSEQKEKLGEETLKDWVAAEINTSIHK